MKHSRDTIIYSSPERANQVTSYAEAHSTPIPSNIAAYHDRMSSHPSSNMLTSDFQSQFHLLLAQSIGAKRVLEIGVFLGYSALVWSKAVGPDGKVTGLEYDEGFAKLAREGLESEGVKNVEIVVGAAADTLSTFKPDAPYDLVFIDADKTGYKGYLKQLLEGSKPGSSSRLLRPGALILADNVLQRGKTVDEAETAEHVKAVRDFNDFAKSEERLQTVLVPLWDGLSVMRLVD